LPESNPSYHVPLPFLRRDKVTGELALRDKGRVMDKRKDAIVELYADGACSGNPGPGGYGAILRYGDKTREISGCDQETTNNRMEMMAVIQGLLNLKRPCRVRVVTDSNYVVRGMTEWAEKWIQRKWVNSKKEPVVNRDLWERLLELSKIHRIEWQWTKGHKGHKENERCDKLAKEAIERCTHRKR
jgi:ribonuclease HI